MILRGEPLTKASLGLTQREPARAITMLTENPSAFHAPRSGGLLEWVACPFRRRSLLQPLLLDDGIRRRLNDSYGLQPDGDQGPTASRIMGIVV